MCFNKKIWSACFLSDYVILIILQLKYKTALVIEVKDISLCFNLSQIKALWKVGLSDTIEWPLALVILISQVLLY